MRVSQETMKLTKLVMLNSWRQDLMNLLDLRSWKQKKWLFGTVIALKRNSRIRLGVPECFQAEGYLHSYLDNYEKMSVCCHCTHQFGKHCSIGACMPWLDLNHWDLHLLERNLDVSQDMGEGEGGRIKSHLLQDGLNSGVIVKCVISLKNLKTVVNLRRLSKQSVMW